MQNIETFARTLPLSKFVGVDSVSRELYGMLVYVLDLGKLCKYLGEQGMDGALADLIPLLDERIERINANNQ